MSTELNRAFWAQQTALLPALASSHFSYTDFTTAVLQNIVENSDLERATYLTCVPEEEPGIYEVSGESFPADRWFVPLKSSELKLLSQDIVIRDSSQRYMENTLTIENKNLFVRVFQISLAKYGTQHILVFTSSIGSSQPPQISDDDKQLAFEYLNLFTYIATSMYLGKADVIECMRRQNIMQTK
jgi:hypothetical protein